MGKAPSNTKGPHRRTVLRGGLSLAALFVTQAVQGRRGFAQTQEQGAALQSAVIGVGAIGMPIEKDLVADFGGSLNEWNAFFATTNSLVKLTIPAGSYTGDFIADGGHYCIIEGAGADKVQLMIGGLFNAAATNANAYEGAFPRFHSVQAGATEIQLVDPSRTKFPFHVGRWCLLMCYDMMGWGFPQNNYFMEYAQITSMDPATGVISFAPYQLKNSYSENYPNWSVGDGFYPDEAGEATIFPCGYMSSAEPPYDRWDVDYIVRGVTIRNSASEAYFGNGGRSILFEDCNFPGFPPDASMSKSWTHRRCNISGTSVEIDKMLEVLTYDNTYLRSALVQSSGSVERVEIIKGSRVDRFDGTPKDMLIENSTVGWLGTGSAYGVQRSLTIRNSIVSALGFGRMPFLGFGDFAKSINDNDAGVLTIPIGVYTRSDSQLRAVPTGWFYFSGRYGNYGPCFTITDTWKDDLNVYCQTSLTGTIPCLADIDANVQGIFVHPCPSLLVENSSGCDEINSYNNHPNGAIPFGSFVKVTMTGPNYGGRTFNALGNFVSCTVTVMKPYTGSLPDGWPNCYIGFFGKFGANIWPGYLGQNRFNSVINLKQAGTTTYTTAEVGTNQWVTGRIDFFQFFGDISAEDPSVWPEVTFELVLDQRIPAL